MTASDIIAKFHLYIGDQSELSSDDELDLLNKVYDDVLAMQPWEFLKKSATGTILSDSIGYYIPFPADFRAFVENNEKTDNSETIYNNAAPKVVFTGPNYVRNQIVNFSDRRQYRNSSQYCYPSWTEKKIRFFVQPVDTIYEFDYIIQWTPLGINDSPIFLADQHSILFFLMCVDSVIINLFDRSHSYAVENKNSADAGIKVLQYWNSQQTFN